MGLPNSRLVGPMAGWRRPAPPPPLSNLTAVAAYSTRLLRPEYAGAALRVRRSSDNAEQDIGFARGVLDTNALLAFVGVNSGFVTAWYDQTGNVRHVTQTTAASQPAIVTSGILETFGGRPTLRFDGSNDGLVNAAVGLPVGASARTMNVVYRPLRTASTNSICGQGSGTADGSWFVLQSRASPAGSPVLAAFNISISVTEAPTLTSRVLSVTYASSDMQMFRDGEMSAQTTATINTQGDNFFVGQSPASLFGNLLIPEITFFNSAISTQDRQTLERNQGEYFGVSVA